MKIRSLINSLSLSSPSVTHAHTCAHDGHAQGRTDTDRRIVEYLSRLCNSLVHLLKQLLMDKSMFGQCYFCCVSAAIAWMILPIALRGCHEDPNGITHEKCLSLVGLAFPSRIMYCCLRHGFRLSY